MFSSAYSVNLRVKIDDSSLRNGFSRAIERKLSGFNLLPFLCMKNTLDSKNIRGNLQVEIALFRISMTNVRSGKNNF